MTSSWYLIITLACLLLELPLHTLCFDYFVWLKSVHNVGEGRYRRSSNASSANHNETLFVMEDVQYYQLRYVSQEEGGGQYWFNLNDEPEGVVEHPLLSNASRHAVPVTLNFTFPFYGHETKTLLITSGGFLYIGDYIHRFLATTQYLAPLMANFDPSKSVHTSIRYFKRNNVFIAEWKHAVLADEPEAGSFTFQVAVHKNGTFVMAYKNVPKNVTSISQEHHPVKVGLADAYYYDTYLAPFLRRRTIYEYHAVLVDKSRVHTDAAIVIYPLPTCNLRKSCLDCLSHTSAFNCTWCSSTKRCSDGFDRHRQSWLSSQCDKVGNSAQMPYECPEYEGTQLPHVYSPTTPSVTPVEEKCNLQCHNGGTCLLDKCVCPAWYSGYLCQRYSKTKPEVSHRDAVNSHHSNVGSQIGMAFTVLLIIAIISMMIGWVVFAYRHPTTNSGLFLIQVTRYRPFRNVSGPSPIYRYSKTRSTPTDI